MLWIVWSDALTMRHVHYDYMFYQNRLFHCFCLTFTLLLSNAVLDSLHRCHGVQDLVLNFGQATDRSYLKMKDF